MFIRLTHVHGAPARCQKWPQGWDTMWTFACVFMKKERKRIVKNACGGKVIIKYSQLLKMVEKWIQTES